METAHRRRRGVRTTGKHSNGIKESRAPTVERSRVRELFRRRHQPLGHSSYFVPSLSVSFTLHPLSAATMDAPSPGRQHHRVSSSIDDFTMLELDHKPGNNQDAVLKEIDISAMSLIPKSHLVIVTETDKIEEDKTSDGATLMASLSEFDFSFSRLKVKTWDGTKFYSDYIKEGLEYNKTEYKQVIMLFESPSSSTADSSFHNKDKYKFHDWPPPKTSKSKGILGPCRYSLMNGAAFPAFLRDSIPPAGLMEHWAKVLPSITPPHFVNKVTEEDTVYAYLPVEQIKNHVNDPMVHYHLAGKDAIHLMTQKTTKLLPDTHTSRPCVVKTTHSMGSKGIFIIRNDEDEAEFLQFLVDSGNPTFVVTDFVDIVDNVGTCPVGSHCVSLYTVADSSTPRFLTPNFSHKYTHTQPAISLCTPTEKILLGSARTKTSACRMAALVRILTST